MATKEDRIKEINFKLIWCMESIEDKDTLNKIKQLQNDLRYYSNKQLGKLLDALEVFNAYNPETINKIFDAATKIEIESK